MGSKETSGNTAALKNADKAWDTYNNNYKQWQNQYDQYRKRADQAFAQDYGNNAADFMQKANTAGIQSANQQIGAGARAATNQAQLASRSAGLSKGQAAMNASGTANQLYQSQWGNAVNQGAQNYGNAVNMNQQKQQQGISNSMGLMGQAQQGMQGAMNTQAGVGANQMSQYEKNMGILSGVGGAAAAAGSLLSDPRAKENIQETDNSWMNDFMQRLSALGRVESDERVKEPTEENPDLLEEVAEKINNYLYHYKPGTGEDPSVEYSGPMAQELLQVDGYRSAVFEGENGLLEVDPGRLAMVNTGIIADLSKRILFLEDFIRSIMESLSQEALQEQPLEEPVAEMPDVE